MAIKTGNSFYGMRVIGQINNIVGLLWALEDENVVLYFYYRDEYNIYSCDRMEQLPLTSICKGAKSEDAFSYLKRISDRVKPSYKVYITQSCFDEIKKQYTL